MRSLIKLFLYGKGRYGRAVLIMPGKFPMMGGAKVVIVKERRVLLNLGKEEDAAILISYL